MNKLIIVCEDKLRKYGDFLAQLISLNDDKDDAIVGIADGTTVAQVWSEKEYLSNAAQISSEQYILFVGNSKNMKDKRIHMVKKFDKYGMQYGWLGKQAVLFVDKVVDMNEYNNFINFAKSNQTDIKKLIEIKETKVIELNNKEQKGIKKIISPVKLLPSLVENLSIQSSNIFSTLTNNKNIEKQEYSCLILEFYLNGLSIFLGLSEE